MSIEFDRTLGTDLSAIEPFARDFSQWAQQAMVPENHIFEANVVLEELITNAVVHGLGEGRAGWIRIWARRSGNDLVIELRDCAGAFDPFSVAQPNLTGDIEERDIGGLGVHFVRTLMDDWRYCREGAHNVVHLRKSLTKTSL